MKEKMRYAALLFAASFILARLCRHVSKEMAFSEVQQQVDERIGVPIHWNTNTASVDETEQMVAELLEQPLDRGQCRTNCAVDITVVYRQPMRI